MKQVLILKIGGKLIDDPDSLTQQLSSFAEVKTPKILVHGGGIIGDQILKRLGIPVQMKNGRRVTCQESMKILTMVYSGLSKELVARLQSLGVKSAGLSGCDGGLIISKIRSPVPTDYGLAGDPVDINMNFLTGLLNQGMVPVVNSLTCNRDGQLLNTNADTVSSFLASRLSQAGFRITLSLSFELDSIRSGLNDPESGIRTISQKTCQSMRDTGQLSRGILPKLSAGFSALQQGVDEVYIGKFRTGFQKTCTRLQHL